MAKEVKAVIFDVGDVLALGKQHDTDSKGPKGAHEIMINKLGISIDQYIVSLDNIHNKSISGQISYKETTDFLSRAFSRKKSEIKKMYADSYDRIFKRNSELIEKAKQLKKEGYKIAILSDQWHMSKESVMPKTSPEIFDEVVISCDEGIRKPDPKIFKQTLSRLKVKPSKALFIDDQKWNIQSAKNLGLKTILFKNNKQLFKHPEWKKLFKNE